MTLELKSARSMDGRISEPRLCCRSNGYAIEYTEHYKNGSMNELDEPITKFREFVYRKEEDEQKAFDDFKKISEFYRSEKNINMEEPPNIG
jgi:hypothetical protein